MPACDAATPACLAMADDDTKRGPTLPASGYEPVAIAPIDPLGIAYSSRPPGTIPLPHDVCSHFYNPRQLDRIRLLLI